MRILILSDRIPPEAVGGAGRVAWSLVVGLRDAGQTLRVIAATPGAPFSDVREGIPTVHLHSRYRARFRAYWSLHNPQTLGALRGQIRDFAPDVVNAFNIHTDLSYAALTLAHDMGLPVVLDVQDVMTFAYNRLRHFVRPDYPGVASPDAYRLPRFYNLRQMRFRYNPLRNWAIRRTLRGAVDVRIAHSEALRQALEANGLPPFRVVHNGIDPAPFDVPESAVTALRERLGLVGRHVVLTAGRMTADKGGPQLLAALAQVPDAVLLVLTQSRPVYLDEPRFAPLRDRVVTGGWLSGDELAAAYRLADVVVVPSVVLDTFPTVNLEAMAAGRPVIATCFGGSPEVVVDGETGFIVNPFDTAQFAGRLERLLADPTLRERMGAAGRRRVEEQFSLAGYAGTMLAVYEEAIRGRAGRAIGQIR